MGGLQQHLPATGGDGERRIDERLDFIGTDAVLLLDATRFTVRLKDLSSFGLCGLTDAPLFPGQTICLLLGADEPIVAEVRWIRKALIGAAFTSPLSEAQVLRLKRNQGRTRRSPHR
jgi:hypothetical protein